MIYGKMYRNCGLCPRCCGIDRTLQNKPGYCGASDEIRVGYVGPHFGEEPPISGEKGSGTVFFTGCSLKCIYCQNHQISHEGLGTSLSLAELVSKLEEMIRSHQVHNINFVTPDHYFPTVFEAVRQLRTKGFGLPMVFNTSGYQSVAMLRHAEGYADIYLPDFKYSDADLADSLSKCRDYPDIALSAVTEMVRQKGFLDVFESGSAISRKGVLVRHLILPGRVENSLNALTLLFLEFGGGLPLSLMSQYDPIRWFEDSSLNRKILETEFAAVYEHAANLGFQNLYVQFPSGCSAGPAEASPYLPDFRKKVPFGS